MWGWKGHRGKVVEGKREEGRERGRRSYPAARVSLKLTSNFSRPQFVGILYPTCLGELVGYWSVFGRADLVTATRDSGGAVEGALGARGEPCCCDEVRGGGMGAGPSYCS